MRSIPLTRGYAAKVDDTDYQALCVYNWFVSDVRAPVIYARRMVDARRKHKRAITMHREILGVSDPGVFVDHIDGDGLNNQRSNLRIATRGQNQANRIKRTVFNSRFKGVRALPNGTWFTEIYCDKSRTSIGTFQFEIAAAIAYNAAAIHRFGAFAHLNTITRAPRVVS